MTDMSGWSAVARRQYWRAAPRAIALRRRAPAHGHWQAPTTCGSARARASCAWLESEQGARLGQRGQQLRRAREHRPVQRLGRRRRVARVDRAAAEHRCQRARLRGVAERRACRAARALSPRAASTIPANILKRMPGKRPRPPPRRRQTMRLLPRALVASWRRRVGRRAQRRGATTTAAEATECAPELGHRKRP